VYLRTGIQSVDDPEPPPNQPVTGSSRAPGPLLGAGVSASFLTDRDRVLLPGNENRQTNGCVTSQTNGQAGRRLVGGQAGR